MLLIFYKKSKYCIMHIYNLDCYGDKLIDFNVCILN